MKTLTPILAISVVVLVAAWLVGRGSSPEGSRTEVPGLYVNTAVLNLGRGAVNQRLEGSFTFVNRGSKTLEILEILPDCGCTYIDVSDRTLRPGDSKILPVALVVPSASGPEVSKK